MFEIKDIDKITEIAHCYGFENQSRQLIEEMAELTIAINKWNRVTSGLIPADDTMKAKYANDVVEEISDVLIMIDQIRCLCGISDETIAAVRTYKLDRQLKRIRRETENET